MILSVKGKVTFTSIVFLTVVSLGLVLANTIIAFCSLIFIPLKMRIFERPPAVLRFIVEKASPFHDMLWDNWLTLCLAAFFASLIWLYVSLGLLKRCYWSKWCAQALALIFMVLSGGTTLGWVASLAAENKLAIQYGIVSSSVFVLLACFFVLFRFGCISSQFQQKQAPVKEPAPKCVAIYELNFNPTQDTPADA